MTWKRVRLTRWWNVASADRAGGGARLGADLQEHGDKNGDFGMDCVGMRFVSNEMARALTSPTVAAVETSDEFGIPSSSDLAV